MTRDVISASRKTSITEVANLLFKNRLHAVPVVENGKILGIIAESDFFTKNSSYIFLPSYISFLNQAGINKEVPKKMEQEVEKLLNATAEDIMSPNCVTVLEDMKVVDLLEFFKTTQFATFPVVNESNNLAGIVAIADIIGLLKA